MSQKIIFQLHQPSATKPQRENWEALGGEIAAGLSAVSTGTKQHGAMVQEEAALAEEIETLRAKADTGSSSALDELNRKMTKRGLLQQRIAELDRQNHAALPAEALKALTALGAELRAFFKDYFEQVETEFGELLAPLFPGARDFDDAVAWGRQLVRGTPLLQILAQRTIASANSWGHSPGGHLQSARRAVEIVDLLLGETNMFEGNRIP